MYTAVRLFDKEREAFLDALALPEDKDGWETLCHHVTVNMGSHESGPMADIPLNTDIAFEIIDFGILTDDDDEPIVYAFGVKAVEDTLNRRCDERFKTVNRVAHITMAVNRDRGAKPAMSNDITDRYELDPEFEGYVVRGRLCEIGA